MNKTERTADELLIDAAKALEEAYYLLNDAADAQDIAYLLNDAGDAKHIDRYVRQSILIVRRIVSNAHVSVCDLLQEMEE